MIEDPLQHTVIHMDESDWEKPPRRGTALLVITIIVLSSLAIAVTLNPRMLSLRRGVRVAVIDSGITPDSEIAPRIVAERSFIQKGNGYQVSDNSTWDSSPGGSLHGTYVAKIIVTESPDVLIVNAKVVTSDNEASVTAIATAIRWAVLEERCDVINLSLGGTPTHDDPVGEAVRWAFRRGAVVVAAAGNSGDCGLGGSSIETPAILPEAIAVGAVDAMGVPYGFTARGPLRNGTAKPDIAAYGFYSGSEGVFFGTSFAAPRVTAAAVQLISLCEENGWEWTPGMVKAALMSSVDHLSAPAYAVGEGLLNADAAKEYVSRAPRRDGLPLVAWVTPSKGPWDFEQWFVNVTSKVELTLFTSSNDTWQVSLSGNAAHWTGAPSVLKVNQTATFQLRVRVIDSGSVDNLRLYVRLSAPGYHYVYSRFDFSADVAVAKVAFEIAHTPWFADSMYGQFREFYRLITGAGIAVEEIRDPEELTLERLGEFDAVILLDPCARAAHLVNGSYVRVSFRSYSQAAIDALVTYWSSGGSIFVVGLDNRSIELSDLNDLLIHFNVTLRYDHVPSVSIVLNGIPSTQLVTDLISHPITESVTGFDFYGCSMSTWGNVTVLAQVQVMARNENGRIVLENRTVLACAESRSGGRLIVSGTNFFLDNWGIQGEYKSATNDRLAKQAVLWLVHLLG